MITPIAVLGELVALCAQMKASLLFWARAGFALLVLMPPPASHALAPDPPATPPAAPSESPAAPTQVDAAVPATPPQADATAPATPSASPAAPTQADATATAPATPSASPAAPTQADAQLASYVASSGLELLRLREALEADPQATAKACERWVAHHPNPSPGDLARVNWLWNQVDPTRGVRDLGQKLAKAWSSLDPEAFVDCDHNDRPDQALCGQLASLGQAAAPEFLKLAQDASLPLAARVQALELLIQLAPPSWLGELAREGLRDTGHPSLTDPLKRALLRRAHKETAASQALTSSLRHDLDSRTQSPALSSRERSRLWQLLTKLRPELDVDLVQSLAHRVSDPSWPVPVRVVFAQLLASSPKARRSLIEAMDQLYPQSPIAASESIVLTQALVALPAPARREFLADHPTFLSPDPALAALSFQHAPLLPEPLAASPASAPLRRSMLRTGLFSPWPQVQKAALDRMKAACSDPNRRRAYRLAGPESKGGTATRSVRRAAIDALARCATTPRATKKLAKLANNDRIGAQARGRALRRYVEQSPDTQTTQTRVRDILGQAPNELGRAALFSNLGQLQDPPDYVVQQLCAWAQSKRPLIARTSGKKALAALQELGRARECANTTP